MNESLIHVEYHQLLLIWTPWLLQFDTEILHFLEVHFSDVVLYLLQGLHSLDEVLLVKVGLALATCAVILLGNFCDHTAQRIASASMGSSRSLVFHNFLWLLGVVVFS